MSLRWHSEWEWLSFCVMSLSGAEKNHKTIVAESKKEDCSITNGFHNAITLRQTLSVGGIICAHFHSHHNTEREKGERNSNFCFFQFRWGLHFRGGVRLAQIGRTGFCRWLDWMWNKVLVLRIFWMKSLLILSGKLKSFHKLRYVSGILNLQCVVH